jgi:preprotein translocase subunit Sec61beta
MGPALVAAAGSLVVSVVGAAATFKARESRLRTELRTELMAEAAIRRLLQSEQWTKRSFTAIKKRLGGFSDDELRQMFVRAGAIRFEDGSGEELWGLLERNSNDLQ